MNTFNDIRTRFEAGIMKSISEAKSQTNIEDINNPYFIEKMETDAGFLNDLTDFMFYLPEGLVTKGFLDLVNKLNEFESEEMINVLNSKDNIDQVKDINYGNKRSILNKLFLLEPKGIGKGEILLSWVIRGARINGGSESYDMMLNGEKYELKDVKPNTAFRLGKEGNVTQMNFYKEIKDTIRRMENLIKQSTKFDLESYMTKQEWSTWKAITGDDISKVMSGEIGYTRLNKFKKFYEEVNKGNDLEVEGFTNLILRGPNARPVELSIEPLVKTSDNLKPGDFVSAKIASGDSSRTYIMSELRRLKYVRKPESIDTDIQAEVDKILSNKSFILFGSKNGIVTKDVKFDRISQGSIKLIQK
jgi:hypothetical protein